MQEKKNPQPGNLGVSWKSETLKWISLYNKDKADLRSRLCSSMENGADIKEQWKGSWKAHKDRGNYAHRYDSLFGKCVLQRCLCGPYFHGAKHVAGKRAGWERGAGKVDRRFKGSPRVEKTFLFWQLWPTFTRSYLSYHMSTHTYTHTHALTHAVTHQWGGKQRHLETSSSGRHWHDLRGLTAFPITLLVQLTARWLPMCVRCGNWWLHT